AAARRRLPRAGRWRSSLNPHRAHAAMLVNLRDGFPVDAREHLIGLAAVDVAATEAARDVVFTASPHAVLVRAGSARADWPRHDAHVVRRTGIDADHHRSTESASAPMSSMACARYLRP